MGEYEERMKQAEDVNCDECNGTGKVNNKKDATIMLIGNWDCKSCKGSGTDFKKADRVKGDWV